MKKQAPKLVKYHYIAQYTIETHDQTDFVKDVYFIEVESGKQERLFRNSRASVV